MKGIFARMAGLFRRASPKNSMTLDEEWLRYFNLAASSSAGISVTASTALRQSTALRCGILIADGIATVPCKLMRALPGGKREAARDHPLYDLMASSPNEWMTSVELRETVALHTVFTGSSYCYVNRVRGQVRELLPLEPCKVRAWREGWQTRYTVDGQEAEPGRIWHMRGPSWNGWQGLDMISLAKEAIGLAVATEHAHASRFGNGIQSTGVYAVDGDLSEEQYRRLQAWIGAHHVGGKNSGKPMILSNGAKWTPQALNGVDAQHLETRKLQVEEVCRVFGVMPIMVGYSDKTATYASAEQMFLAHVVHTVRPWHRRFEASMNAHLLTREERRDGFYFKFFDTELLRGAAKDRAEYYDRMFRMGTLSPNRILELEDEDGYEGGDKHFVPLNMSTVEGLDAGQDADKRRPGVRPPRGAPDDAPGDEER